MCDNINFLIFVIHINDECIINYVHAFFFSFVTIFIWGWWYSETLKSTSSKMLELSFIILKMILEGYGLPKQYTSDIEQMKSSSNFRLMKYKVPQNAEFCETALLPHTDKSALTILCENEVQGLEVLTKSNKWIPLKIPQEGFVVIIGDVLKVYISSYYML